MTNYGLFQLILATILRSFNKKHEKKVVSSKGSDERRQRKFFLKLHHEEDTSHLENNIANLLQFNSKIENDRKSIFDKQGYLRDRVNKRTAQQGKMDE